MMPFGLFSRVPDFNGDNDWILPLPATYVVDNTDGRIHYRFLETNPLIRAEPIDLFHVLPPLQPDKYHKTLEDELEYEMAMIQDSFPEQKSRAMENEIRALQQAGIADAALQQGQKAAEFKLKGSSISSISSSSIVVVEQQQQP
jgi:hypothetical protein